MSSFAVFEAAIRVKSTHLIKSCWKPEKGKIWKWRNFYINLHQKDRLDRIHSFLRRVDARGSVDIIHHIWC